MVNTLAVENEAKQTIEALQTELQKTKETLQAVEELKSQSGICAPIDEHFSFRICNELLRNRLLLFFLICCFAKYLGGTGKLVDSYISGKIMQLKDQIATLEKREER